MVSSNPSKQLRSLSIDSRLFIAYTKQNCKYHKKKQVRRYKKKVSLTESTDATDEDLPLLLTKKQQVDALLKWARFFPIATIKICPRFAPGNSVNQDSGDSIKSRKKAS